MNLLFALFLLCFEATYEGLKNRKKYFASEVIEDVYRGVIALIGFGWIQCSTLFCKYADHIVILFIGYIFLRFGIFSQLYNLVARKPFEYLGTTKWLDRKESQVRDIITPFIYWPIKAVLTFWGTVWLLGGRFGLQNIFN